MNLVARFWLGLLALGGGGAMSFSTSAAVEILRDPWGTPHVFAEAEADGFFGLGYAAAEDRLLQMELIRRKAAGRLAEVFGPQWVDADREARIAGHAAYAPRAFARLPERWQVALRAYAAGVNAWRAANPDTVGRRFKPLGIEPEPWTPADCLLASRGILSLGSPFQAGPIEEYHRFRELLAQVGEAEAERQSGFVIDDAVAIVAEAEMAKDAAVYERLKQQPRMPGFELRPASGGAEGRRMSHAWAVSGRRSTTGKPILESDPQLTLSSPPFFYEFHLAAGRIDARGLGIPGCPGLFIGWNRRIAWGGSALGVDSHVVFLDRLTPDGKGFVHEDGAVPFERRLERIEVRDAQPVIQEVFTSRHGTVFNSLVRAPRAGEAYVLYDAQTMDDGANARMMLEVMEAGNWEEFRQALEHYYSPGLHVVYADVDDHVGYHTMVHRPRTPRSPRRALEGWTGREEVRGRIRFEELPHLLNPSSGYVSHANNLPVGSWYPYDLGLSTGGTGDTGRSLRLRQLLEGDRVFSPDDFERVLHRDDVNALVAGLLPVARRVAEEDKVTDPVVQGLLAAVEGWDLHDSTTDRYPAARGLANALTPYRGAGLNTIYGAGGGGVAHLARELGARFARDGSTPTNTLVRAYLLNWLRASAGGSGGRAAAAGEGAERNAAGRPAARATPERLNANREAARRITIPYQRTIPHNLPVVDPSQDIQSPPLTCLDQGTVWSQPGNLYSQIVDLADVDRSRSMMAPGNAEDGPYRTNQIDLWVKGTLHAAPLSRAKIEALGGSRTSLTVVDYQGPVASPPRTVAEIDPAARLVPALPPVAREAAAEPRPLPGRRPEDPRLEAAFRTILRQGTSPEEVDAQLAECRDYVKGDPGLTEQLRNAAVLGVHLIREAAAGRLRVPYGSPHAQQRLEALLKELDPANQSAPEPPPTEAPPTEPSESSDPPRATATRVVPEVWLCAGERLNELCRPEAEWPETRRALSGLKLYVDQINGATPEALARLVRLVNAQRYQVAVELGGCLDFAPMDDTAGEWSARHELAKLAKWYAAGGTVDFLDVDGPIRRLLHPENRRDGRRFDSLERAADELVDALRLHRQAHPNTRFWLLTNFPNWGWRGDVSYHARGPRRQDYGDYDEVLRVVLPKLAAAGLTLEGVTVDNPYDYLVGEHRSVNLSDPRAVDWLRRVRDYEDFARAQGLAFNLIVNSERGGHESDERFFRETLEMVDVYRRAGGQPTRWFVQSWYPHPRQIVPESAPPSLTALVKAVGERVRDGRTGDRSVGAGWQPAPQVGRAPQRPTRVADRASRPATSAEPDPTEAPANRIVLAPHAGAMQVTARVPMLDNQSFALGLPETIGCREAMLVNFPEARVEWQGPDAQGVVSCAWSPGGRIWYSLRLLPGEDTVDVEMTIRNHTEFLWHDAFAFHCLNPIQAPTLLDWDLERTYLSQEGKPKRLAETTRVRGSMPTVGFYLPERVVEGEESVFVRGFRATSPDRTDGSWIITLSEPSGAYMAATAHEIAFLFDNVDRCCIHAAPSFGDIGPGEASTVVSRLYLARGTLDTFLQRLREDRATLAARQRWARR
ncbi:MAG: penicillin acylase family protein [Verrucomicrobiales bacterium]|nr:penicillin acylase family protein [Verrucomicrobiales bacterium]